MILEHTPKTGDITRYRHKLLLLRPNHWKYFSPGGFSRTSPMPDEYVVFWGVQNWGMLGYPDVQ